MEKFSSHDPYKKLKCIHGGTREVQDTWKAAHSPFYGNGIPGSIPGHHCGSPVMLSLFA